MIKPCKLVRWVLSLYFFTNFTPTGKNHTQVRNNSTSMLKNKQGLSVKHIMINKDNITF